jgi:hypothetical protein
VIVQLADRFRRTRFDRVRHAQKSHDPTINDDEHYRLTLGALLCGQGKEILRTSADFVEECAVAKCDHVTVDCSLHAFARQRFERLCFC